MSASYLIVNFQLGWTDEKVKDSPQDTWRPKIAITLLKSGSKSTSESHAARNICVVFKGKDVSQNSSFSRLGGGWGKPLHHHPEGVTTLPTDRFVLCAMKTGMSSNGEGHWARVQYILELYSPIGNLLNTLVCCMNTRDDRNEKWTYRENKWCQLCHLGEAQKEGDDYESKTNPYLKRTEGFLSLKRKK